VVPINVPGRKGKVTVFKDEEIYREGVEASALAKLRPVFNKDGTVRAKKLYVDNHLLPLPTVYSVARDSACYAKFPSASNETPAFINCTDSIDAILSSHNEHPNTLTAIHLIRDIFLTAR